MCLLALIDVASRCFGLVPIGMTFVPLSCCTAVPCSISRSSFSLTHSLAVKSSWVGLFFNHPLVIMIDLGAVLLCSVPNPEFYAVRMKMS